MDADDWKPPSWWKPWSDFPGLLAATRHTVARLGDEPFMTWLDDKCREELTISFNDVWNQSAAIAVLMSRECVRARARASCMHTPRLPLPRASRARSRRLRAAPQPLPVCAMTATLTRLPLPPPLARARAVARRGGAAGASRAATACCCAICRA